MTVLAQALREAHFREKASCVTRPRALPWYPLRDSDGRELRGQDGHPKVIVAGSEMTIDKNARLIVPYGAPPAAASCPTAPPPPPPPHPHPPTFLPAASTVCSCREDAPPRAPRVPLRPARGQPPRLRRDRRLRLGLREDEPRARASEGERGAGGAVVAPPLQGARLLGARARGPRLPQGRAARLPRRSRSGDLSPRPPAPAPAPARPPRRRSPPLNRLPPTWPCGLSPPPPHPAQTITLDLDSGEACFAVNGNPLALRARGIRPPVQACVLSYSNAEPVRVRAGHGGGGTSQAGTSRGGGSQDVKRIASAQRADPEGAAATPR